MKQTKEENFDRETRMMGNQDNPTELEFFYYFSILKYY